MEAAERRKLEDLASRVGQTLVRGANGQPDLNTVTALAQDLNTVTALAQDIDRARKAAAATGGSHAFSVGALDALAWVLEGARGEIRDETPSLHETLKAVFDMIMQWG